MKKKCKFYYKRRKISNNYAFLPKEAVIKIISEFSELMADEQVLCWGPWPIFRGVLCRVRQYFYIQIFTLTSTMLNMLSFLQYVFLPSLSKIRGSGNVTVICASAVRFRGSPCLSLCQHHAVLSLELCSVARHLRGDATISFLFGIALLFHVWGISIWDLRLKKFSDELCCNFEGDCI